MTQFHHTGTGREMPEPPTAIQHPKETPFSKYAFCFIIGMLAGAAVTTLYFISI